MHHSEGSTWHDAVVALLATAVALGGALAHAFEHPTKIGMTREHCFIVQRAYDGWKQLAYVLAVELAGILAVIVLYRSQRAVFWAALTALGFLVTAQVIFWVWTYPANVATEQWTAQPANWEALRLQWEYSHLAGAAFQVLTMAALIVAVLQRTVR
ncbi:MAG: hypothetical protein APF80_13340 [Alphaproteobacteria bacterium BRH_c36]|nr:MAG: hypothetical protein APF80_13340 [Alphaproteobacteria bacterium BRH_c36]